MHTLATARLKILVVNDDADTAWTMGAALKYSLHCIVRVAEGAAQAIDMASEIRPDVILMDIDMPGIDGIEAAGLLRWVFSARDMPRLLAISGYCGRHARGVLLSSGFDDYLEKPVSLETLIWALGDVAPST